MSNDEAYLIYTGKGSLFGVPARNLTEAETFIHGEDRLLKSGLYRRAFPKVHKSYSKKKNETKDEVNNE